MTNPIDQFNAWLRGEPAPAQVAETPAETPLVDTPPQVAETPAPQVAETPIFTEAQMAEIAKMLEAARVPAAQTQGAPQAQSPTMPPQTIGVPIVADGSRRWGDYTEAQLMEMSVLDMMPLVESGKLDKTVREIPIYE